MNNFRASFRLENPIATGRFQKRALGCEALIGSRDVVAVTERASRICTPAFGGKISQRLEISTCTAGGHFLKPKLRAHAALDLDLHQFVQNRLFQPCFGPKTNENDKHDHGGLHIGL